MIKGKRPIAELLSTSDRDVVLISQDPAPLIAEPPVGMSQVEWLASVSDTVFFIEVSDISSRISNDRNFVVSQVTAEVLDIIKRSHIDFQPGQPISFLAQGGELVAKGGKKLTALLEWAEPLKKGGRYLIFATIQPAGELVLGPTGTYELKSDRFVSQFLQQNPKDTTSKVRADEIIKQIRQLKPKDR